jgi:benzoylformate decarboxylase
MPASSITAIGQATPRHGTAVLLGVLCSEGVEQILGNSGTTELPLMDTLNDVPEITAGGLGHGMGNLLNSSVMQTSLVVTAGQQDSCHVITDPLLFGDLVRIATPAVK